MEFSFRAKTKTGQIETGSLIVDSKVAAVTELRARGLMPLKLTESSKGFSGFALPAIFQRITLKEKLTYIKNLAVMTKSGVPLARALRILSAQTPNKRFAEIITNMSQGVESGKTLSEMFAKNPEIFSNLFVSLSEVGEATGNLDKSLDYLGSLLSKQNELIRKTKGALTYPLVVLATLVLVGILMFVFVLPKLTSIFSEFDVELPFATRVLIATVEFASGNAVLLILGIVFLFAALIYFLRTITGKQLVDWCSINLPVISGITTKINLARLTLTLGVLLKSSMQIVAALKITSRSAGNSFYHDAIEKAAEKVKAGVALSQALESDPKLFPGLVSQMIKVGEESGSIENILQQLGEYYQEEVDQVMKNLSSIIEPVLVVVIGAVVGVIAVSLILPIYSITQAI